VGLERGRNHEKMHGLGPEPAMLPKDACGNGMASGERASSLWGLRISANLRRDSVVKSRKETMAKVADLVRR
jgi:hypothetical protein